MYRYTSVRSVEHYGQSRYYEHFVSGHSADTFNLNFFRHTSTAIEKLCWKS